MNEKIQKLAEQAGLMHILADHVKQYPGYQEPIEKFAELLLDNVLDVVEQAKNDPFVSLDDAKRMAHFVNVTKKKINKTFRS